MVRIPLCLSRLSFCVVFSLAVLQHGNVLFGGGTLPERKSAGYRSGVFILLFFAGGSVCTGMAGGYDAPPDSAVCSQLRISCNYDHREHCRNADPYQKEKSSVLSGGDLVLLHGRDSRDCQHHQSLRDWSERTGIQHV